MTIGEVDQMTHEQLCRIWRFAPAGTLKIGDPVTERFQERLFKEFGGFTPAISKRIGWGH